MRSAYVRQIVSDPARSWRFALAGVLAVSTTALLFGVAGCSGSDTHEVTSHGGAEVISVNVTLPETHAMGSLVVPGRVKAREEVTLTARVGARLTALPIREGDRFERGAVLARFDAPEAQDAVRSARQAVLAGEARVRQATADEERMHVLFESRVVAERDVELAELERATANAALANARAELQRWEESTAITAPFRGIVARRHVDPGQTLAPGAPLLDLRTLEVGEIEAAIPESALPWLEQANVTFSTTGERWLPARLTRVDGMTDFTTRTRVAAFAPEDAGELEPGAFARVRLLQATAVAAAAASSPATMTIPESALVHRGALTGVYVVRDERAWLRWLRVGETADGRIEVLAGVTADEPIVLDPTGLEDGRGVRVDS